MIEGTDMPAVARSMDRLRRICGICGSDLDDPEATVCCECEEEEEESRV